MVYALLFLIPLLIPLVFFLTGNGFKYTFKEFLLQVGAQTLVVGMSVGLIFMSNVRDTEILNGHVTKKSREKVSCSHSYRCNCVKSCSGTGSSRTCTEICSTCYEHSYDVSWFVYSSIGNTLEINRVDRRGLSMPPRWDAVIIGEPFSVNHSYVNYIKGSSDSLFRKKGDEKYLETVPEKPLVYDYYRANTFIPVGVQVKNPQEYTAVLRELNKKFGSSKQVNLQLILTSYPYEWIYALDQVWFGGRKNDATTIVGVDKDLQVLWVKVLAWSDDSIFAVSLENEIRDLGVMSSEGFSSSVTKHISKFKRKPMADFSYLAASVQPTYTQFVVSLLIGLLVSIGILYFFHKEEVL